MYKLIIFIGPVASTISFSDGWPEFLHHAEAMPGLVREATIRVRALLFGDLNVEMIHELYFETQADLQWALASPSGQAAGAILQEITAGQVTLLIAEHKEDSAENLRSYRQEGHNADTK